MLRLCLFVALAIASCSAQLEPTTQRPTSETPHETIYSIHVPRQVRPGSQVVATVAIIRSRNPVEVSAKFTSADGQISFIQNRTINHWASTRMILGEMPISYQGSKKFNFSVEGFDQITRNILFKNSTTNFEFETKSISMMIQTDKPMFRPGETMQFRALCMTPELRPLTGVVTYKVQDPKGNVIFLKPDVILTKGVASGHLNLSRHAMNGEYSISFNYKGTEEKITVTVQSYKLPKFEVKVTSPIVIYPDSEGFNAHISANYTFGQPVSGQAVLKLERKTNYGSPLRPPRFFTKTFMKFEGKLTTMITMEEIVKRIGWDIDDGKLEITAFVTETLTSTTLNSTAMTDLKKEKIKVKLISRYEVAKPGLKYKALIQIAEQDGNLLMESDRLRTTLKLSINYNYRRFNSRRNKAIIMNLQIPPNGFVPLEIDLRNDNFTSVSFRLTVNNSRRASEQWSAQRALSPSDSFLQITHQTLGSQGEVSFGQPAEILIRTTEPIRQFRVMVISRGVILSDEMISRTLESQQITYSYPVTREMMPSILLLVSYMREDNKEIVVDSLRLKVRLALQNQMTIETSEDSVDAGSSLYINVTTSSPQSFVGLRAVDRSLLLLRSGYDVTEERVADELNKYSESKDSIRSPFFTSQRPQKRVTDEIFNDAKVNVLTNALVYKYPENLNVDSCSFKRGSSSNFQENEIAGVDVATTSARIVSGPSMQRPRSLFPETWLWTSAETRNERSVSFNITAPDTITSWHISAFSMSETHGLGIATPQELTVFRKFFITLNMPLKITRGEIVVVQAIVFNYFEQDLTANIRLNMNGLFDGVELLHPGDNSILGSEPLRQVVVPAGSAISIKYPLRVTRLGDIPIRITATSSLAVDSVVRSIFVKPEGIQQCYTSSVLISKSSDPMMPTIEQLSVQIPEGIINGSANATLHVYGDVLGSAMTNLDKLLKAPSGCGEQNMINFAPNVFVTRYLQQINKLSEEMKETAIRNIVDGYMNQLRYKRIDGSFSAFGEEDASGSTWLTAFVVKCFNFASELQPELVEKSVVDQALNFLTSQQKRDGSFKEPGRVIHQAMQGGVRSSITMTAYVLITLTETQSMRQSTRLRFTVNRAISFLEKSLHQLQDPYELALVAYALTAAESQRAEEVFDRLTSHVTPEGGLMWTDRLAGSSIYSSRWEPPYTPAVSHQIEATSYLLLTYALRQELSPALPHLKWLVSKQNQLGGYSSTQDTVMAVQTLWKISTLLRQTTQNLALTVTLSYDSQYMYPLTITEQNSLVYNFIEVSPRNGTVQISALGSGVGIAQLSVCYNIPTSPYEEEPFRCKLNVTKKENNEEAWMDFCCALREDNMEPTGMFLFEIGMLNGFTIDVLDEERRNPRAKLIELEDGRVNVYFNQLLPRDELCTKLKLFRVAEVAAIKPATVKAFEYYKPGKIVVRQYNVSGLEETGVCDVCGYECLGCPAPILSDWKDWTPCVEFCKPENSTREQECIDPSLNKKIDFFRCGLEEVPIETRLCNTTFTCPNISDGLWYQVPRSFRSYEQTPCHVIGSWRSPYTVIPGSMLDGHDQYLQCSINILNIPRTKPTDFTQIMERLSRESTISNEFLQNIVTENGFTISFLAKPHFYREEGPVVFLSIGEVNEQPILVLEKPIQRDFIRLVVSFEKKRDFVENIPLNAIPFGNWSHIMIVWKEQTGAKVFVNGTEVGQPSSAVVEGSRKITKNLQFNLGKRPVGDQVNQGYFPGSFSALHYWNSPLPQVEVDGLSTYYKEIIKNNGTEPLLSVRHLRELVPQHQSQCFTKPQYLSHIYAEQKCG